MKQFEIITQQTEQAVIWWNGLPTDKVVQLANHYEKSIDEISYKEIAEIYQNEQTKQPTKKQEIKYYLTEGMTEIIPLAFEDWQSDEIGKSDKAMDEWATKLQQSKNRIKASQELQDKLNDLPFTDWAEIEPSMFKIEYSVLEGEVTLMAYIKN
ncbi:MAG: hypothetical protein V4547_17185 [Bacteroidota bacterium]